MVIDYASAAVLTDLEGVPAGALEDVGAEPVEVCWPVHALVIQPTDAARRGFAPVRLSESQIRPAGDLVAQLLALDSTPLNVPREQSERVVGTCRHFAVLSCALLRYCGIPSRVRCGFATYFQPGLALDHWITEYRDGAGSWVRIDPEILGRDVVGRPEQLEPGQFLSGGEAWHALRQGTIDASKFGVCGTDNWGPAEIRGNAVKDLAALNKVEMLPWDEWGRMTDAYEGRTGADYDRLLDNVAEVSAGNDLAAIKDLYDHEDLRVPEELIK